jgi:hypothetical protein
MVDYIGWLIILCFKRIYIHVFDFNSHGSALALQVLRPSSTYWSDLCRVSIDASGQVKIINQEMKGEDHLDFYIILFI